MEQTKSFNLFRVNCLLNDTKSANFNSIILSVIYEYFYEDHNGQKTISEIYRYIKEYLKISIDFDFLQNLINSSQSFEIDPLAEQSTIRIKSDKFQEIEKTISLNSISVHLNRFIEAKGLDSKYKESIESLLYAAVFENINSFSIESLKSLIPNTTEEFSQDEIDVYNAFLDFGDEEKNRAIFNILSRAVEFAILTSGKGIKEISKDIFSDKTFILDTNILFRLLGVGGEERLDSTKTLLEKCKSLGIKFEYTGKTHVELNSKLDQIIQYLNLAKVQANIDLLAEVSENHPELFNDDFIVHYSHLKKQGVVNTPEQYQRKLHRDYQSLIKGLEATVSRDDKIDMNDVVKFSKTLLARKKEMRINYGKRAAEVDAYNVILVRRKRRQNNYNLSDVKSFYLTSDRSLNIIISKENNSSIPETILPSQLYILCKPYFSSESENDYEEFTKFIKRRKTVFKYGGSQVLHYINSIREITSDIEVISEALILYSDVRYRVIREKFYETESNIPNYKTMLKTLVDNQIDKGREAGAVFEALKSDTSKFSNDKFKSSRNVARIVDLVVTIAIVPLMLYLSKLVTDKVWIQIGAVIVGESLKFYLSSRFKFFNRIQLYWYKTTTRRKREEFVNIHDDFVSIIESKYTEVERGIWSN